MQNQIQLLKVFTFTALLTLAAPLSRADDSKGLPAHGRLLTALKNGHFTAHMIEGFPGVYGEIAKVLNGHLDTLTKFRQRVPQFLDVLERSDPQQPALSECE